MIWNNDKVLGWSTDCVRVKFTKENLEEYNLGEIKNIVFLAMLCFKLLLDVQMKLLIGNWIHKLWRGIQHREAFGEV